MSSRFPFVAKAVIALCLITTVVFGEDPSNVSGMIDQAKKTVFELRVRSGQGDVYRSGTGFLVKPDGTALTNFHVVQGAQSATAHFDGVKEAFAVELIDADPGHDLALIKISPKGESPNQDFACLPILESESGITAQEVWAVGYPKQLGFTVTKGIVNGLRKFSELPPAFRTGLSYAEDSRWIQTDCTINPGNSGGPLINSKGQVVGINTWKWLRDSNIFFALSAQHGNELISKSQSQPLGFAQAASRFGNVKVNSTRIPSIVIAGKSSASDLISAVDALKLNIGCVKCKGSGTVDVFEKRMQRTSVNKATGHEMGELRTEKTGSAPCDKCLGTRFNTDQAVETLLSNLVKTLSKLDPNDKRADQAKQLTENYLTDLVAVPGNSLHKITEASRKRTLAQSPVKIGSIITGFGYVSRKLSPPDEDKTIRVLNYWYSENPIMFINPTLVNLDSKEVVFYGGILSGMITSPDGTQMPVIERGFMIRAANRGVPISP